MTESQIVGLVVFIEVTISYWLGFYMRGLVDRRYNNANTY